VVEQFTHQFPENRLRRLLATSVIELGGPGAPQVRSGLATLVGYVARFFTGGRQR
jgi:hypothetical protein